jgi:hypothetical protein
MTSTVSRFIIDTLPQTPGQALAAAPAGILVGLLLLVLVARLLVGVADVPRGRDAVRTLDVVAVPLFIALAFILSTRVLEILPLG